MGLARAAVQGMVVLLGMTAIPALALDGAAVEYGKNGSHDMLRVGAQWLWQKRWLDNGHRHIGGYWDLALAQWQANARAGEKDSLIDLGLTPVLRWQSNDRRGFYIEAGIGAHLISSTELGDKRFGSRFQFGDHLGLGYRLGDAGAWDLSYRFQHHSNADIKKPNDGLDFHQIRLQYWFR